MNWLSLLIGAFVPAVEHREAEQRNVLMLIDCIDACFSIEPIVYVLYSVIGAVLAPSQSKCEMLVNSSSTCSLSQPYLLQPVYKNITAS